MGSNLAAGGAALWAAHQESRLLALQTWHVRSELYQRILGMRWCDDLWLLVAGTPSPA